MMMMMVSSYLWLCQAVLGRQFVVVHQAYHQLEADQGGIEECGWCGDAVGRGGTARGPSQSGEHSIGAYGVNEGLMLELGVWTRNRQI